MEHTVVGKSFWIGVMNASCLSVPLWLLMYLIRFRRYPGRRVDGVPAPARARGRGSLRRRL